MYCLMSFSWDMTAVACSANQHNLCIFDESQQFHLRQNWKAVALKVEALQVSEAGHTVRQVHHAIEAQVQDLQGCECIYPYWQCVQLT